MDDEVHLGWESGEKFVLFFLGCISLKKEKWGKKIILSTLMFKKCFKAAFPSSK